MSWTSDRTTAGGRGVPASAARSAANAAVTAFLAAVAFAGVGVHARAGEGTGRHTVDGSPASVDDVRAAGRWPADAADQPGRGGAGSGGAEGGGRVRSPVVFSAGERVEVPEPAPLNAADLVIYGSGDVDAQTGLPECAVTSRQGTERVVGLAMLPTPDDIVDQTRLVALHSVRTWRAGDVVLCDGPGAASFEPLALALDDGQSRTGAYVLFAFAVAAFVMGAVVLALGLTLRRRPA